MSRFGCYVGLLGLAAGGLVACSEESPGGATPEPMKSLPSAGGTGSSYGMLEQDIGRLVLVGESDSIAHFEREYRGFALPGETGTDRVSCTRNDRSGEVALEIEAGLSGAALPQVEALFQLPSAQPSDFLLTWSEATRSKFRVRLGEGDALTHYEYAFGYDEATAEASSCHVLVTEIDEGSLKGSVACRGLVATFGSADGAVASEDVFGGRRSASATFDFSCPFRTLSGVGGGGSASGGSGSGGASSVGGAPPSGGSAGSTGSGGAPVPVKSCKGSTTPCSLRSELDCEEGTGCTYEQECSGVSSGCYAQFGSYSCYAQDGCVWSSYSENCSGLAWSCSSYDFSSSCVSQLGCSWDEDCTGVAASCTSQLTELSCVLEPGCRWE